MNSRILIVLFSVFFVSLANAVPVKHLYRAEIKLPVADSEADMLNEAFSQAVEQVLVRVSGDKAAITGDLLKQAQSEAPTWVAQHSVMALSQLLPVDGQLVAGKQVTVVFYAESIDRFLSQNNLPVWGSDRPSVLVWAVSEDHGVRHLSGANAPSELLNDLAASAVMSGVPIYAPLIDSVDNNAISSADVWGFFEGSISQASKRYQTDAVAAIRVADYAGSVSGSLLVLLNDGSSQRFTLSGDSLSALTDQASATLAKVFSTRYAAVRNNQAESRFTIHVSGIKSYGALNAVQTYLEHVGVVRDVAVVGAKDDTVLFSIAINGSQQKLINSISLNSVLQVTNPPPVVAPPVVALPVPPESSEPAESSVQPEVDAQPAVVAQPKLVTQPTRDAPSIDEPASDAVEYFKYSGVQ